MNVLAFQPWDGGSHRSVRESIERHGAFSWDWVCLPARGARWRLRLGAAELVTKAGEEQLLEKHYDVIFATSMLDAAQLRALLPPSLRNTPLVVYMHENQLAYPVAEHVQEETRSRDAHLVASNVASMLAADLVLFNSKYNRDSFLEGLPGFLRAAPDRMHAGWRDLIHQRSRIAWPPVEPVPEGVLRNPGFDGYPDGCRVAWPHRFEHDKGPDALLELVDREAGGIDMRLVLLGERFRETPEAIERLRERHAARIDHDGWIEGREDYLRALSGCDWVLSTARHEFFGIAVVEALLCGCLPWLPSRLSYPELLPDEAMGCSPLDPPKEPRELIERIRSHLEPALAPTAVAYIESCMQALG
jgi:glycosyltransferase involved in cell wall biosynthesis